MWFHAQVAQKILNGIYCVLQLYKFNMLIWLEQNFQIGCLRNALEATLDTYKLDDEIIFLTLGLGQL